MRNFLEEERLGYEREVYQLALFIMAVDPARGVIDSLVGARAAVDANKGMEFTAEKALRVARKAARL